MPSGRPPIPAELRRRVLVEAGHRCAIPTCRYIEVDIHHIVPWAKSQKHEYKNLIALCSNCHRRADNGDIDRKSLHLYKGNLRFVYDKFERVEIDLLFALQSLAPGNGIQWPPANEFFIRRIVESDFVSVTDSGSGKMFVGGMEISPKLVRITDKGREFLESIGANEL